MSVGFSFVKSAIASLLSFPFAAAKAIIARVRQEPAVAFASVATLVLELEPVINDVSLSSDQRVLRGIPLVAGWVTRQQVVPKANVV